MKKLIATIAAFTVALGAAFAQDLAAVTEVYNAGAEAVSTDKAAALKSFEEALKLAEALGDEGQEIVANCKNIIPNIRMSLAKDLVKESKFDEAVAALQEVEKVADGPSGGFCDLRAPSRCWKADHFPRYPEQAWKAHAGGVPDDPEASGAWV